MFRKIFWLIVLCLCTYWIYDSIDPVGVERIRQFVRNITDFRFDYFDQSDIRDITDKTITSGIMNDQHNNNANLSDFVTGFGSTMHVSTSAVSDIFTSKNLDVYTGIHGNTGSAVELYPILYSNTSSISSPSTIITGYQNTFSGSSTGIMTVSKSKKSQSLEPSMSTSNTNGFIATPTKSSTIPTSEDIQDVRAFLEALVE